MLDKDKLILLFNVYVGDISPEDTYEFLQETAKNFIGYFDESVKCIFAITKDESKQTVQNITDFPEDGMKLIEELVEFYKNDDKDALKLQIDAVQEFLQAYKK